jgi:hypothetical protein
MNGADDRLLVVIQLPAGFDRAAVLDVARFAAEFASSVSEHLLVVFQPGDVQAVGNKEPGTQQINAQIKKVRTLTGWADNI